jgi:hypothetical protein
MGAVLRARPWVVLALGVFVALVGRAAAQDSDQSQNQHKTQITPGVPGVQLNHRLILKDGSYQIVRKYEVVGDRVRYISVERGGDWEELPLSLVDWDATKKWERDHTDRSDDASPAMREAAAVDKEEADERQEEKNRMPEVAKGLELPDQDSVFVLDTFQGTPELVELPPNTLAVDARTHHGLGVLNPMAAQRAPIELPGSHAKVHLHVSDPAIYLSLNVTDNREQVLGHAMTVQTKGAPEVTNGKHGAHSTQSGFAIVRVDERQAVRIVGLLRLGRDGKITQSENVIPTKVEVMPGAHWLKVTPEQKLEIGDYALVEILSPSDISETVWDFRVNPMMGDNEGSIGPIVKQASDK